MAIDRIVIAGCGSIGQRHARLLAKRPDLQIELCDTSPECLKETQAIIGERTCFEKFHDMLATKPDAVVIATPHAFHAAQAISALENSTHVLCEKPMSDNLAAANRMVAAAKKSRHLLDFGFTLHFHPALLRLKELIAAGQLGEILHVHCRVGTYATLAASRSRHQATVEAALLLDYVHQPDIVYWLTGAEPRGVYMAASQAGELPLQSNPNMADILIDHDGPLRASIHLNYIQHPQRHEYEVAGGEAWALLDMETNHLRVGTRHDNSITNESFEVPRDALFEAEHQAFFDAIAGQRKPESPAETAIVSMRVTDAAIRSWKSGTRIAVDQ